MRASRSRRRHLIVITPGGPDSDRVVTLRDGRSVAELTGEEITEDALMQAIATGAGADPVADAGADADTDAAGRAGRAAT